MRVCALLVALLPGCLPFQHREIEAPPDVMSVEERLAAYDRLRAAEEGRILGRVDAEACGRRDARLVPGTTCLVLVKQTLTSNNVDVSARFAAQKNIRTLKLGDGKPVEHPSDLVPLVGEDSLTGKAAKKFEDVFAKHQLGERVGAGITTGSLALMVLGAAGMTSDGDLATFAAVLIGGAIGTLIGPIVMMAFRDQDVYNERNEVFRYYPGDLLKRLNLCETKRPAT